MSGSEEYDKLISELFSKHRQMMYKMAFVILKNPVDAEDAVQIAFIHISKHTENISQRSDKDREGYLIKTIKNVCHDLIRSKKRTQASDIDEIEISSGSSVEDTAISVITVENIKEALSELSERDRDILYFKMFKNYAPKEVAKELHISERNISVYIERARKRLIEVLRKRGITNDF